MEEYKLGKLAPVNKVSIKFEDFLTTYLTKPIVDNAPIYNYPMFGNDIWGDCACADEGHSEQVVTGLLTDKMYTPTMLQIETWYQSQNPNWSPTSGDEGGGMSIQLFLEYLVAQKLVLGFASIDHRNTDLLQSAIYLGLSVKVGVQLQQVQQGQQFIDGLWDYVPGSPVIGGHDICFVGYNATTKRYQLVSWGKLIECTQAFVDNCVDEAWIPIRQEHVDHPSFWNHFDLQGFSDAVKTITGGKVIIPVPATPVWPYKYFKPSEVVNLATPLIQALDNARGFAGVPFVITSGFRTLAQNQACGGAPNSTHLLGEAADIACSDQNRWQILQGALKAGFVRIEVCTKHIHLDIGTLPTYSQNWLGVSVNE